MTTARRPFKRFYKNAAVVAVDGGFTVELDGRRIRTPKGKPLVLPNSALAEAIAAEWNSQGQDVDPQKMPLMGLANAAIDHIASEPRRFVEQIVSYAQNDLLCYRADKPPRLVERQSELWDPMLDWVAEKWAARFNVVQGVMPQAQPQSVVDAIASAVAARDAFALAGLFSAITLTGSTVLALALAERKLSAQEAWEAARIDEIVQGEDWGVDSEAELRAKRMGEELVTVERFLRLVAA